MPNVPEWKKKKAFRMRLERRSYAEVARECHMSSKTISQLELGWTDKAGVFHPGWKEELEAKWELDEQKEYECGLAVKNERIAAYERLAKQAIELIEKQFPTIRMKNASDAKALLSEVRELCRLISIERGDYRPNKGPFVAVKADINVNDVRDNFERARQVEVEEIEPPREDRRIDADSEEREGDGAGP